MDGLPCLRSLLPPLQRGRAVTSPRRGLPELPKAPGATQPAAPTPPPAAPVTFGNGTHQVGVDIRAGTYRTPGPERSYCFWRRLDRNQEWIDFGSSSGPIVVVIRSTDWGFESSGCKPWKRR